MLLFLVTSHCYRLLQLTQELWAVDLDLCYNDVVAMSRLFQFATGGRLDVSTHLYLVPAPQRDDAKIRHRNDPQPSVSCYCYY